MIEAVTVINHLGESLRLDLYNPYDSGLAITKIEGLGPAKAVLNYTDTPFDGALDNLARLEKRNIVLSLRFFEKPSIEATRYLTYKFFPTKKDITLVVETDTRTASITGRVESNEPDIFSQEEGCQISIICADPNFYKGSTGSDEITEFFSVEPEFEFPFENNSASEDLIEFGSISTIIDKNIYYEGDNEIGVVMELHATGTVENVHIYEVLREQQMFIDTDRLTAMTGYPLISGDTLTIDTRKSHKSLTLVREGQSYNVLNCLGADPDWIELHPGDNQFTFLADDGAENLQFKVRHRVAYGGV